MVDTDVPREITEKLADHYFDNRNFYTKYLLFNTYLTFVEYYYSKFIEFGECKTICFELIEKPPKRLNFDSDSRINFIIGVDKNNYPEQDKENFLNKLRENIAPWFFKKYEPLDLYIEFYNKFSTRFEFRIGTKHTFEMLDLRFDNRIPEPIFSSIPLHIRDTHDLYICFNVTRYSHESVIFNSSLTRLSSKKGILISV